jgi:hypothetical protein
MHPLESPFCFDQFTPDELKRVCWLRAVEWLAWPAFLSQPLLPIFYLYSQVYWVLLAVVLLGFLWLPLRHRFASLQLATLGSFWVRLKWATIPIGLVFLFHERRYTAMAVTLATPVLASWLNAPAQLLAAWVGKSPAQIGIVQQRFLALAQGKPISSDNSPVPQVSRPPFGR